MDVATKVFYVYGLGLSGRATVQYLVKSGAIVYAYDDKSCEAIDPHLVKSPEQLDWSEIDYLVLSPGIQILKGHEHPVYKTAMSNGITVISDLDLFYLSNPKAKYLAITGTNGKSTTTALIGHILTSCGIKNYVGGNIGVPILELPAEEDAIYVIETSSYQLDLIKFIRFDAACLTNLTPDHLDRHGDMAGYLEAKLKAFEATQPDGKLFFSLDYSWTENLKARYPRATSISTKISDADLHCKDRIVYDSSLSFDMSDTQSLLGQHNMENILFAYAMTRDIVKAPEKIMAAIRTFKGLAHRMELVGRSKGLTFINDSKATNADSTEKALASLNNIIWILGGVAKAGGINSLQPYMHKIKQAYLIGQSASEFAAVLNVWGVNNKVVGTLDKAVAAIAQEHRNEVDATVLLSPVCASFDQFKNFEERGAAFVKLVRENFPDAI